MLVELAGLALLLAGSAFFSATEIALFALSKLQVRRLRQDHPAAGQLISEMLDRPPRLLSSIRFGNTLVNIQAKHMLGAHLWFLTVINVLAPMICTKEPIQYFKANERAELFFVVDHQCK